MTTSFENFVNRELPKRPSTEASPTSWTAGKHLVTTGIGLGVEAIDFIGGKISGEFDMRPQGGSLLPADAFTGCVISNYGPYTATLAEVQVDNVMVMSTTSSTVVTQAGPAHFFNYSSGVDPDASAIYFGFANSEMSVEDIRALFSGQRPVSLGLVILAAVLPGYDNLILGIKFSSAGDSNSSATDNQVHTNGQKVEFHLDNLGIGYQLMVRVEGDSSFHMAIEGDSSLAPTGMKPFILAIYSQANTGFHPIDFQLGGIPGAITVPADPVGKRYLVSHGGTYLGQTAQSGDIVEFLTEVDIFVTRDVNLVTNSADAKYATQATVSSLSTAVTNLGIDVQAIQTALPSFANNGEVTVANYPGVAGSTTTIDLTTDGVGGLKIVTWADVGDYIVNIADVGDNSRAFRFLLLLVFPPGNELLAKNTQYISISGTKIEPVHMDAYNQMAQLWEYESGVIRALGYVPAQTLTPGVMEYNTSMGLYSETLPLADMGSVGPTYTNTSSFTLVPNETILTNVRVDLTGVYEPTSIMRSLRESGVSLTFDASTYGISNINLVGYSGLPFSIPQGEVQKFLFMPARGALIPLSNSAVTTTSGVPVFAQEATPSYSGSYMWWELNPDSSLKTLWVNIV